MQEQHHDQPVIGFHDNIVQHIFYTWKSTEKEYAKNMMQMFKSVRKQHENIGHGIEDMKGNFKDFLLRPDGKQEKLEYFIESFNKFTEEFPELRPDDQTKEELNNRCDILNEDLWDILESNKDGALKERERLMTSGWVEHELQQLTIKAQQFFSAEIKRCINTLNFIHDYFLSKKAEKPLSEYKNVFPKKYPLSLLDESNSENGPVELPKVEDPSNPSKFPFLEAIFTKALGIIPEIDNATRSYDPTDFEILQAINKEKEILLYRFLAIRNWTMNGLKDIRLKIKEAYDVLDDWVVVHVKNENEVVNDVIKQIRDVIETTDSLDPDLKFPILEIQEDDGHDIKFIETIGDKSFISGKDKYKFSLDQAIEYFSIFRRFARDDTISTEVAKEIFTTNVKLNPDMIPPKWKISSLSYLEMIVDSVQEDEDVPIVNWRQLLTYCVLAESLLPVLDRDSILKTYKQNLLKVISSEFEQHINLENFLKVEAWFDNYLSMRRKEDVKFEEDKQEIDEEIRQVKTLIFNFNVAQNGQLHIENFVKTLKRIWQ